MTSAAGIPKVIHPEESPAGPPPDIPAERLHPLYLFTGLGNVAKSLWGLAIGGGYLAFSGRLELAIGLILAVIAFQLVGLVARWLTFEYRLGEDELRIDSGIISRNSRAIPFDRVTDVDIEQGPLQRVAGLATVRMETGASGSGDGDEGVLDAVALDRAEAIRDHVRRRRRQQSDIASPTASDEAAEEEADTLFVMDTRRVAILGLFNFSLAVIAALFAASQSVGELIGLDIFSRAFWGDLVARSEPLQRFILAHQIGAVIGGIVSLLIVGFGTGLIRTFLREHGFTLQRTESGFRRRRGLLTLTDVSIPETRVQAAILATGPIRRRFGWFAFKLQSLATDGGQGDHVVAPLAREEEAAAIHATLDRPIGPVDEAEWKPVHVGHVTSFLPLMALLAVPIAVSGLLASPWVLAGLGVLAMLSLARWLEFKRARYALESGFLFIDSGWWRQRRAIIPVARIQSIDIAESFWTRLFGFVRFKLGIAGGTVMAGYSIDALDREDAEGLRKQLVAR